MWLHGKHGTRNSFHFFPLHLSFHVISTTTYILIFLSGITDIQSIICYFPLFIHGKLLWVVLVWVLLPPLHVLKVFPVVPCLCILIPTIKPKEEDLAPASGDRIKISEIFRFNRNFQIRLEDNRPAPIKSIKVGEGSYISNLLCEGLQIWAGVLQSGAWALGRG